jgi:hypothetical protein
VREPVVLEGGQLDPGQGLHHADRLRALDGNKRVPRAGVHRHRVAGRLDVFGDMSVIGRNVRRVDDQQEMLFGQPVHEQVVDERTGGAHQAGIVGLADLQLRRVVARNALDRVERVSARDLDLAHVADVEQAGARAHGHVFGDDAGVFDRHIPAAEGHHAGA